MTRSLVSVLAALSAALVLASVAGAQSADRDPSAPSSKLVASAADSTVAKAKPVSASSLTYAQLRAAMSTLSDQSSRFVRLRGLRPEHVTLVDVRNLFRHSDDQRNYEQALMEFERSITSMRAALQESLVLRDLLNDRQLKMSQVIGVETTAGGRAIVFYQPE